MGGLAYFVRLRWWRRWGGPWTFVLKDLAILRRKRRKVSCCVLVPFACCINPRGWWFGSANARASPGGGALGLSRSRRDLFGVPGSTYGVPIQGRIAPGEQAMVLGICRRQYTSWTTLLVVGIKLEEQTNPF